MRRNAIVSRYIATVTYTVRGQWKTGQELSAIAFSDGILLKPKKPFQETTLAEVAGCLHYQGKPKSLDEIENAIRLNTPDHGCQYRQTPRFRPQ